MHPADIENLTASCATFATLGKEKLELHLQRKNHFTHLTLYGCYRHQDNPHPLSFLCGICEDDDLAYYPVSLSAQCCTAADEDRSVSDRAVRLSCLITNGHQETMMHKFLQTGYIDEDLSKNVIQDLLHGNRCVILGLLLILLPNLEVLSLDDHDPNSSGHLFDKLFANIVGLEEKIRDTSQFPASQALTRLVEVHFTGDKGRDDNAAYYT